MRRQEETRWRFYLSVLIFSRLWCTILSCRPKTKNRRFLHFSFSLDRHLYENKLKMLVWIHKMFKIKQCLASSQRHIQLVKCGCSLKHNLGHSHLRDWEHTYTAVFIHTSMHWCTSLPIISLFPLCSVWMTGEMTREWKRSSGSAPSSPPPHLFSLMCMWGGAERGGAGRAHQHEIVAW